jgi:hypothetical protein
MFDKYVCGVNGLPCCGCSLFCQNRKEKVNNNTTKPGKNDVMTEDEIKTLCKIRDKHCQWGEVAIMDKAIRLLQSKKE